MQTKPGHPAKRRVRLRFALDAAIGLVVFMGLCFVTLGPSAAASLLGIDEPVDPPIFGTLPFLSSAQTAWDASGINARFIVLAAVFSALFALNNAFVRHLRKSYVHSRRIAQKQDELKVHDHE